MKSDIRVALRRLRHSPGFAMIAALTLALGIGATVTIFSAVYAVVLRPLPYRDSHELVRIYSTSATTSASDEVAPRAFIAWRRQNRSFTRVAPIESRSYSLTDGDRPARRVTAARTTSDYFAMLGVQPLIGRAILPDEERRGNDGVTVLSHRYWQAAFGGDRSAVGRVIRLNGDPVTVIGVMPAEFDVSAGQIDLWTPIAFTVDDEQVKTGYLEVIGRLQPGVDLRQAEEDLTRISRELANDVSADQAGARLVPYVTELIGPHRQRLLILLGAVAVVLLTACANVANLLLARGAARTQEVTVRATLGATRSRIVRQLLVENMALAVLGGMAGTASAFLGLRIVKSAMPESIPRLDHATVDGAALGFALVLTLLTGALFGVLPALRAARLDLHTALRHGGRASHGAVRAGVRQMLLATQVALSLILLVGAGLLIRSAIELQRVEPGMRTKNLWSAAITLPPAQHDTPERITRSFERIVHAIDEVPGVRSAAAVSVAPFTGLRALGMFVPEGRPVDASNALMANLRLISPKYFETTGIPLRAGRLFLDLDDADAPSVAIVNEAFARMAWSSENALGKHLYAAGGERMVVGVVGATREDGLREDAKPAVYFPMRQVPPVLWQAVQNSMFVVARTEVPPASITRGARDVIHRIDRGVPLFDIRSIEQRIDHLLSVERFNTRLLSALGIVALLLSALGIHATIAHFVADRKREIGVRMALGARPAAIVRLVLSQGMRSAIVGMGAGLLAAMGLTRLLANQLYGINPTDTLTFAGVATLVTLIAVLAAIVPARIAARTPPREALGN